MNTPKTISKLNSFLRTAKILHRITKNGSISQAMPIIRRLNAADIFYGKALSQIFKERLTLQRKHFLRLLAIESGYKSWEEFKPALESAQPLHVAESFTDIANDTSVMKIWCSSELEAKNYVAVNGGEVLQYGDQAMVLLADK